MRFMLPLILAGVTAMSASARSIGAGATFESLRAGHVVYAPTLCPAVNSDYEEFSEKLESIKTAVRKEANCVEEKAKFDGFSKLVEEDRKEFLQLVNKGAEGKLTGDEAKKISVYIDSVTKAGAAVADVLADNSCFRDERKNDVSLELVSGVVSEATQAVAPLIPVYGNLVAVGGKITSSLITSIDKVVRARTHYDFSNSTQRKAFIKSLCAYDGFRSKIDEVTRIDDVYGEKKKYVKVAEEYLQAHLDVCPQCRELQEDYFAGVRSNESWAALNNAKGLLEHFDERIRQIDSQYSMAVAKSTLLTVSTIRSVQVEMTYLNTRLSDLGDVERDRVVSLQDSIEEFFYVKAHPKFVEYYLGELKRRRANLVYTLYGQLQSLAMGQEYFKDPKGPPRFDKMTMILFEGVPKAGVRLKSDQAARSYASSAKAEVNRQLSEIMSVVKIIEGSCQYARGAPIKYDHEMHRVCDILAVKPLRETYGQLLRLLLSTHEGSPVLSTLLEIPGPQVGEVQRQYNLPKMQNREVVWARSWTGAVTKQIEENLPEIKRVLQKLSPTQAPTP